MRVTLCAGPCRGRVEASTRVAERVAPWRNHSVLSTTLGWTRLAPQAGIVAAASAASTRLVIAIAIVRTSNAPTHDDSLFYDETVVALAYLEFAGKTLKFLFIDKNGSVTAGQPPSGRTARARTGSAGSRSPSPVMCGEALDRPASQ